MVNDVASIILGSPGAAPALISENSVVTYAELCAGVEQCARGLLSRGRQEGDRVGIFSENVPFFVYAYFGILRAGMVAVPMQTEISEPTFTRIARDAGISELFVSGRLARRVRPWAESAGVSLVAEGAQSPGVAANGRHKPGLNGAAASNHRLACLMFTSGSTGQPKGVMISHRNILCNTRDIVSYMGLTRQDRVMVVLPFHYCYGLSLLHSVLMTGGSLVLNNHFRLYPEMVLREMRERECTGFAGVPSTYQILLRRSRFRQMRLPKLRWLQQAGGRLPIACIQEVRDSFPHVRFFTMYGQTEATARLSYLPPERLGDKLGSVGTGLPSTKLEVLRPDGMPVRAQANGKEHPVNGYGQAAGKGSVHGRGRVNGWHKPDGHLSEAGEIVASGDNIAQGYWNDPVETARYFRDGKLHTGDLARVDEDGFIYIVERERDIIKSGGNRVSAKEVEDVISELPDVVEVAVVGFPHELLGEAIKAFVVPRPQATLSKAGILAHCRKRLPDFNTPEEVVFLGAMPHNGAGKIMKQELRKLDLRPSERADN